MYTFLIWHLLQPFPLLCLLLGFAMLRLWRQGPQRRGGLLAVTVLYAGLVVLSLPAVSWLALRSLEGQYPPLRQRPLDAQAIVVLAGAVEPPSPIWPRPELDRPTLRRCQEAALVYGQGEPCPLFVSGGKSDPADPGPPPAPVMADYLRRLGVRASDLIVEDRSRTTYENARACRVLLEERHIRKVVLVTGAIHLPRAVGCFRKEGIEVVPWGCDYRATTFDPWQNEFIPSPGAALGCQKACHEWLGLAWYWLHGRL